MGVILGSKVTGDSKITYTVSLDQEEALQLKGHIDEVYLFSDKNSDVKTNIAARGKNEATKYFLVPKEFRKGIKLNSEVSCQKVETRNKIIFIYTLDKFQM